MSLNNVLFSHNSDHWSTPDNIYNYFVGGGYIDPCPLGTPYDTELVPYVDKKLFINPPYSCMDKRGGYVIDLVKNNCEVVLLVPARTDTKWWHNLLELNPIIYFFKGRLKFSKKGSAPFPSVLLIFKPNNKERRWTK